MRSRGRSFLWRPDRRSLQSKTWLQHPLWQTLLRIALENAGLFAELQRSAITDPLTGVYNTRFFHEILGRDTARAERYTTPLSLLMIDVDSFKVVNDTYGHVVGNKVLAQIAKTVESTVRNTDFVCRCGGDEFGVVLPGTNIEGAMHVAEKILQKVESSNILTSLGYSGPITVSIGLSEYHGGSHLETLVAEADQALYASKRSSGNCVRSFEAGASFGQKELYGRQEHKPETQKESLGYKFELSKFE